MALLVPLHFASAKFWGFVVIKVLIVDDSAVVRKILSTELGKYSDIQIVGAAPNPFIARDMIVELKPDVLTLDIEMPKMDGLTFLSKLMKHYPMPVIIVSSLTRTSMDMTIKALEVGAVDVVSKPGSSFSVGELIKTLVEKIRLASRAKIKNTSENVKITPVSQKIMIDTTSKIVAIGASTGGTEAIREVLEALPQNFPGIVIAQHMPAGFTTSFAERLNDLCKIEVKEAEDGEQIVMGRALLAPGNYHLTVKRIGAKYFVEVKTGPQVHYQRPSVDVLFDSVAKEVGKNAIGVILTGMGADGAAGIKKMKESGSYTIGQDEKSCVVYGMPRAAFEMGGIVQEMPLQKISAKLVELLNKQEYTF
jgi:two-component system chemotaxis response regulator CheB